MGKPWYEVFIVQHSYTSVAVAITSGEKCQMQYRKNLLCVKWSSHGIQYVMKLKENPTGKSDIQQHFHFKK